MAYPFYQLVFCSIVVKVKLTIPLLCVYTVSQKKACDYIFCNNLNNECPIIIIFGTLINETICHRMVV